MPAFSTNWGGRAFTDTFVWSKAMIFVVGNDFVGHVFQPKRLFDVLAKGNNVLFFASKSLTNVCHVTLVGRAHIVVLTS